MSGIGAKEVNVIVPKEKGKEKKMVNIILILFVLILAALLVIGFLYYYNAHEAEPLTPEQAKEIRENYEKKDNSMISDDFMDSTIYAGAGIIGNTNGIADDFWNL